MWSNSEKLQQTPLVACEHAQFPQFKPKCVCALYRCGYLKGAECMGLEVAADCGLELGPLFLCFLNLS